jgi:MFS family permease
VLRVTNVKQRVWPDWIDHDLTIVLAARACMSVARAIAGVITALYLEAEGFSAFRIGMLFLCVAVTSAVMSSTVGMVSDVLGRKAFLIAVPFLASLAACVFSLSHTAGLLFVFGALGSFGRGAGAGAGNVGPYQPAESAFVAEIVPDDKRTDAFGRLSFVSSIGALVGGLLAGLARPGSSVGTAATSAYRPAFLAAAALSAIAGLLAVFLSEPGRSRQRKGRITFAFPRRSWGMLWRFWITNGTNGMAIGMFGPFVSYWFHRRFGASPAEIGALFAVINAMTLISSLVAADIGRKFGTVRAIVGVRLLGGVLLIPMALSPDFWVAGVIYLVRMLAQRVGLPLRQSFTQSVADPDERASLAALSNLPAQGTQAGSQVLAGYLFDDVSLSAPMILAGALQTLNALTYAKLFTSFDTAAAAAQPVDDADGDVLASPLASGASGQRGGLRDHLAQDDGGAETAVTPGQIPGPNGPSPRAGQTGAAIGLDGLQGDGLPGGSVRGGRRPRGQGQQ